MRSPPEPRTTLSKLPYQREGVWARNRFNVHQVCLHSDLWLYQGSNSQPSDYEAAPLPTRLPFQHKIPNKMFHSLTRIAYNIGIPPPHAHTNLPPVICALHKINYFSSNALFRIGFFFNFTFLIFTNFYNARSSTRSPTSREFKCTKYI